MVNIKPKKILVEQFGGGSVTKGLFKYYVITKGGWVKPKYYN